jgi:outer membrane immunogenic protein
MLRATTWIAIVIASIATVGPALATDLSRPIYKAPAYSPAPSPAPFSWTGFYVGGHGGYGWNNSSSDGTSIDLNGYLAGVQGGYNYQLGQFIIGLEGDYSFANVKYSTSLLGANATVKNDYFATVAARLGYAFDRTMLYGKVGYGWTRDKWDLSDGLGGTASGTFNRSGYLLGGGVEYAFMGAWSVKLEYDYLNLGTATELPTVTNAGPGALTITCVTDCSIKSQVHLVKAGINYRF